MRRFQHAAVAAAVFALLAAAVACSVNPATGKQQLSLIGEQQEIALGREANQQISASMGLYDDAGLTAYVGRVGASLAAESERPDLPWNFSVVDDPTVNAFALPGGYLFMTRGILAHLDNEAEMAGVLGHEIGHVTARHSVEQLSRQQLAGIGLGIGMIVSEDVREFGGLAQAGLGLLFLKYGRDDERQADDLGLRYMTRDGYDPRQLPRVFETLERVSAAQGAGRIPEWLSTHPNPGSRATRLRDEVAAAAAGIASPRVARADYLGQLDGVVFGDDPRQGYFDGSVFYHPQLAFQIDFPDGWKTANQRQQVLAVSPQQDAAVVLTLADATSAAAAAESFFAQQGIRATGTERGRVGGLEAVSGNFLVDRQGASSIAGQATFVEHDGRVFRLLGYTTENLWGSRGGALQAAVGSFRHVTDRGRLDVEPARIDLVKIPSAMTLREFQGRYNVSVDLQTVALINQGSADTRFEGGTTLKRVVGGR